MSVLRFLFLPPNICSVQARLFLTFLLCDKTFLQYVECIRIMQVSKVVALSLRRHLQYRELNHSRSQQVNPDSIPTELRQKITVNVGLQRVD